MLSFLSFFSLTADQMFLEILNRSLAAVPVILAVLISRLILKKLPRRLTVVLWLIVFFRLLLPFTLESSAGLLPQEAVISPSAAAGETVPFSRTLYTARQITEAAISDTLDPLYIIKTPQEMYYLSPSEFLLIFCGHIWGTGMAAMALYSLVSFLRLKRRLVGAMKLRDNIWLSDGIGTPFVTGVVRPKIYLPSSLSETDQAAILAHEQAHIRHLDPALKLFSWLGLCLHWFNPLAWFSFQLLVKDMETACDEAVTAFLPPEERADYADTLLRLSTGKRAHAAAPLAFGEGDPQGRIRRIFNFEKPKTALTILAAALVVLLSFYLVTENSKEPHLLGGGYQAAEILYAAPISDPTPLSVADTPDFCVTGDYHLLSRFNARGLTHVDFVPRHAEEWTNLGKFSAYSLDKRELNELLSSNEGWTSSWRPGRITDAWWLQTEDEVSTFFLLFQTSAGETLLAIGYEDLSERGQTGSDDTTIHYLFRLRTTNGVFLFSTEKYFELDAAIMTGQPTQGFAIIESRPEKWVVYGFSTENGGLGYASYEWLGSKATSQLKDGFAKLLQFCYYEPEELEHYVLGVPDCYIAPDAVVTLPGDDPEVTLTIDRTYDAVFVANETVHSVKRIVAAQDGTILSEAEQSIPIGDNIVVIWPRMFLFSWAQEEGHNPCSVSYHFYDIDGNELS